MPAAVVDGGRLLDGAGGGGRAVERSPASGTGNDGYAACGRSEQRDRELTPVGGVQRQGCLPRRGRCLAGRIEGVYGALDNVTIRDAPRERRDAHSLRDCSVDLDEGNEFRPGGGASPGRLALPLYACFWWRHDANSV